MSLTLEKKSSEEKLEYYDKLIEKLENFSDWEISRAGRGNVFIKQLEQVRLIKENNLNIQLKSDHAVSYQEILKIMNFEMLEQQRAFYLQNFEISRTRKHIFLGLIASIVLAPFISFGLSKI